MTGRGRITFEFRVYPLEIAKKEPFHASYELEDCGDIREIMVIARENNKIELVPQA